MTERNEDVISKSTFRTSIIASIVASVIFIALIQPIMTYIWEVISSTSNDYLNALVDKMYKNAALGERDWVVATFATVGVYIPFVLSSSKKLAYWINEKSDKDKTHKIENAVSITAPWIWWGALFFGVISATFIASYIYTDMQLNASFNQRLMVLSPHITEIELKKYKADWASMTSKADYQILNKRLQTQADSLSIKLPLPLIKD
ncbi:hypothetical protein [Aeromonas enteropelogenes]|uniref:hypothetical protein n=1 Tax=Aeromonas enteropelogenes TaxID=29489 RepID=UPI003B9E9E19